MPELKDYDMTGYTNQMLFDELSAYLTDVMGMNAAQVKKEFYRRGWEYLLDGELFE